MAHNAESNDATNILPVPPALEFPFPRNSDDLSTSPTITLPTADTSPPTDDDAAVRLENSPPEARPILADKKFLTEGPAPESKLLEGKAQRPRKALPSSFAENPSLSKTTTAPLHSQSRPSKTRSNTSWLGNRANRPNRDGNKPRSKRDSDPDYGRFSVGNDNFKTKGKVDKTSGRLDISVNETANRGYLGKALDASLNHHLLPKTALHTRSHQQQQASAQESGLRRPDIATKLSTSLGIPSLNDFESIPPLNIVIMVIGSRGDIQPFLKIGKLLKENHGHNVRIATHPAFKAFVEEDCGLSFFSVGGDPSELMAFMVKNPGLIPSVSTVRAGEIGRRRDAMFEMFQGFWRACINATDDETDTSNLRMMGDKNPFVADAIIANPPSFAHVHCAERLGIPLHLMFTFPYSPTQQFPHPLANIKSTNVDPGYTNFMSYPLVEMMTWQGLGDLVNRFRVKTLGLEPVSTLWAPGQLFRLKVPYTYLWSPGLIPKPTDWGPEIDIAGFVFLDLASSFKPPAGLTRFLESGEPPVYIGFGSIVVDDPDKFTTLIFEAVKKARVRALVSKGWGGLGDEGNTPDNVYMLENTPHDWLFPRVSAVVHHGGAGTTAIGLKCGKPTMIVPFFGDQPFWGAMVAKAGAGSAVPYKQLTADALADGIRNCLSPEAKWSAEKIAHDIEKEGDGAKNAVKAFHNHLPLIGQNTMRCCIFQDRVAVWVVKNTRLTLSSLAAELLVQKGKIKWQDLRLTRHYDWNDFEGPGEPITGGGAALASSFGSIAKGIGGVPVRWAKSLKKHEQHQEQRERRRSSAAPKRNIEDPSSKSQKSRTSKSRSRDRQANAYESKGQLSQGGQHGIEKKLPEANTLGNVPSGHEAGEDEDSDIVGPLPSHRFEDETSSYASDSSEENIAQELAEETGQGFAKSGQALAKVPMNLSLAIAQGFHNAPRLYGDTTVRTTTRITGFHSGLQATGEEFIYGIYDGVTGIVLQPYRGAKKRGALGFVTGIGKGFGGFILKDFAALTSVAYTFKGIHKEMTKGKQPTAFIRRARVAQGYKEIDRRDQESLHRNEQRVEEAWKIVCEVKEEIGRDGEEGLMGRIREKREIRRLRKQGAFSGSVWGAKKVVEERKMSRFVAEDKAAKAKVEKQAREQYLGKKDNRRTNRIIRFGNDKAQGKEEAATENGHLGEPPADDLLLGRGMSQSQTQDGPVTERRETESPSPMESSSKDPHLDATNHGETTGPGPKSHSVP